VTVHPTAAIAPGVLLQADPDSQLIIGAGVCIGIGSVLHAHQGVLEISAGAILGSGVLIVGRGKIGANACIGSSVTILHPAIEPEQFVKPGSLLGDTSRSICLEEPETDQPTSSEPASPQTNPATHSASNPVTIPTTDNATNNGGVANSNTTEVDSTSNNGASAEPDSSTAESERSPSILAPNSKTVYGRDHMEQMLGALFPHRQTLNPPPPTDPPPDS
jgi:carbon dioxide concentrating mechanism protein CcmN